MGDALGTVRPARAAIHDLVDDLMPTARRPGREDERVPEPGAGSERRVAVGSGGDLRPVVDGLLDETWVGLPW